MPLRSRVKAPARVGPAVKAAVRTSLRKLTGTADLEERNQTTRHVSPAKREQTMDIRVGVTVQLKSGLPIMTVEGIYEGLVSCLWFDGNIRKKGRFKKGLYT